MAAIAPLIWLFRTFITLLLIAVLTQLASSQGSANEHAASEQYTAGLNYLNEEEYRSAARSFERAIEFDRTTERYHFEFGKVVLEKLLDPERAVRVLAGLDSVAASYWLGLAYATKEPPDPVSARRFYRSVQASLDAQGVDAHPTFPEITKAGVAGMIDDLPRPEFAIWKWLFALVVAMGFTALSHRLVFTSILQAPGDRKPATVRLIFLGDVVFFVVVLGIVASSLDLTTRGDLLSILSDIASTVGEYLKTMG